MMKNYEITIEHYLDLYDEMRDDDFLTTATDYFGIYLTIPFEQDDCNVVQISFDIKVRTIGGEETSSECDRDISPYNFSEEQDKKDKFIREVPLSDKSFIETLDYLKTAYNEFKKQNSSLPDISDLLCDEIEDIKEKIISDENLIFVDAFEKNRLNSKLGENLEIKPNHRKMKI